MVSRPKTELERTELTSQLEETLGTDTARNLMAHIPPINTEQLATKDDLLKFATKDDLLTLATKDDLLKFATKDDLLTLATKDDLLKFATKDDLLMVKDDLNLVKNDVKMVKKDVDIVRKELEMVETNLNIKMDAGFKELRGEMKAGYAQLSKQFIGLTVAIGLAIIGTLVAIFTGIPIAT